MSSDQFVPWEPASTRLNEIGTGVALAAAAAGLYLPLALPGQVGLLLFLAAVLVASRWWGRTAGLAATATAVATAAVFVAQPGRAVRAADVVPVGLLAIVGFGVAWWTGGLARRAERDERESRLLKDEFLATVSHELRTPLNAILGWIQLLRLPRGITAEVELERGLEVIERNARRQLALVEDLLVAAGPALAPAEWQPIHVRELVAELLADLADTAAAASVTLLPAAAAAGTAPPVCVSGDRAALRLALRHVLANAIKFTPSGGQVRTAINVVGDRAHIVVSDTGDGIEPKLSRSLFEPFRQRDGSATRAHGGLGLGLTVAQRLIEAHRGRIEIRSAGRGQGATVAVSLPAAAIADATQPPMARSVS